jgi:sulfite exporter TauE/SafE
MNFWIMFGFGLISSLHCVQMCGPIVISYSAAAGFAPLPLSSHKQMSLRSVTQHLAYNGGRILTYTALGAVAGLLGKSIEFVGRLAGLSSAAMIVSGVLMIVAGVLMFGSFRATSRLGNASLKLTSRLLRPLRNLLSSRKAVDRFYLGLALGFLPCGLVYMALLRSVGAGTAVTGAVCMLGFGIGTSGALLALGVFSSAIKLRFNQVGSRLAAVSVMALGVFLLWRSTMAYGAVAGIQACHGHH